MAGPVATAFDAACIQQHEVFPDLGLWVIAVRCVETAQQWRGVSAGLNTNTPIKGKPLFARVHQLKPGTAKEWHRKIAEQVAVVRIEPDADRKGFDEVLAPVAVI